jgi:hypothetical protein
VLHGPENDRTLGMRNWLGYNMARWMGRYASRTQYFELFLNTVGAALAELQEQTALCWELTGDLQGAKCSMPQQLPGS